MSTAAIPTDRYARQRDQALDRANRIRLARAALKRQITAGRITASEVILRCPAEAETCPVFDLLIAQHRWGVTRTRNLLARLQVSEMKPVGDLTERQRRIIADQLGHRETGEGL